MRIVFFRLAWTIRGPPSVSRRFISPPGLFTLIFCVPSAAAPLLFYQIFPSHDFRCSVYNRVNLFTIRYRPRHLQKNSVSKMTVMLHFDFGVPSTVVIAGQLTCTGSFAGVVAAHVWYFSSPGAYAAFRPVSALRSQSPLQRLVQQFPKMHSTCNDIVIWTFSS
jgi:hypothetical protein